MMAGEVLLDAFVNANILFALAYCLWLAVRKGMCSIGLKDAHGLQLSLLNCVFAVVVLAPAIVLLIKSAQSAGLAPSANLNLSDIVVSHYLNGGFDMEASDLEGLLLARDTFLLNILTGAGWLAKAIIVVFLAGFAIGVVRLLLSVICLHRIVSGSFEWRSSGRVRLRLSDRTLVPFSTRGFFCYYVVIPSHMLSRSDQVKVALAHEFQHIRQGDLEWEILLELLKPVFFLNPAFHAWKRMVEELRELNCDSKVLARGAIDTRTYCETLLSVCQRTLRKDQSFVAAVPKVTLVTADRAHRRNHPLSFVEHRIHILLSRRASRNQRVLLLAIGAPLLVAVVLASLAIQRPGDWSHDRLMLSTVINLERMEKINRSASFGRIDY